MITKWKRVRGILAWLTIPWGTEILTYSCPVDVLEEKKGRKLRIHATSSKYPESLGCVPEKIGSSFPWAVIPSKKRNSA